MNRIVLGFALAVTGFATVAARAQVTVTEQRSADKSATRSELTLTTRDRETTPLVMDTRETKVDAATTRAETVTQVRRNDGTLAELNRVSSVSRKNGSTTETSAEVMERDRQGDAHVVRKISETTTKTGNAQQSNAKQYRRDSSGNFVLDREVSAQSTKNSDGTISTVKVERDADVNGKLAAKQQVEETVTPKGANEKSVTRTTKSVGLEGRLTTTSQESETVATQGNTTRTETTVMKPGRGGMVVAGKISEVETRGANGSVQREIIEQGRSLHSTYAGDRDDPLVANRKTVEKEVRNADGSARLQRDVFLRDVNGDWKPVTFSTEPGRDTGKSTGF